MRWHILFTLIPSILLWTFFGKYLLRYKKTILFITLGSFLWAIPVDVLATPILKIYFFNPTKDLGIHWLGLPLEEYLFILLIPQVITAIALLIRRRMYG